MGGRVSGQGGEGKRAGNSSFPGSASAQSLSPPTVKNSCPTAPVMPTMARLGPDAVLAARTTTAVRREGRPAAVLLPLPAALPLACLCMDCCIVRLKPASAHLWVRLQAPSAYKTGKEYISSSANPGRDLLVLLATAGSCPYPLCYTKALGARPTATTPAGKWGCA